MKKIYQDPEMEIVRFADVDALADVIDASGGAGTGTPDETEGDDTGTGTGT
jgi:hypothetical protein